MNTILRRARRDEDGASAVEYGLLIAGIAALLATIVWVFGGMVSNVFSSSCTTVASHAAPTSSC